MTSNFVDYVKILVRSGKGGAGSAHLLRVKYNAKAGPDGGDGGRGGHVMLRGNTNRWTLLHLKYTKHVFAENGQNGPASSCARSPKRGRQPSSPKAVAADGATTTSSRPPTRHHATPNPASQLRSVGS